MEDLENNFRSRLQDAETTGNVDADKLWADITAGLDEEVVPPVAPRQFSPWWSIGSLLVVLVIAAFYFVPKEEALSPTAAATTTTTEAVATDDEIDATARRRAGNSAELENEEAKDRKVAETVETKIGSSPNGAGETTSPGSVIDSVIRNARNIPSGVDTEEANDFQPGTAKLAANDPRNPAVDPLTTLTSPQRTAPVTGIAKWQPGPLELPARRGHAGPVTTNSPEKFTPVERDRWSIGLFAGSFLTDAVFTTTEAEQRELTGQLNGAYHLKAGSRFGTELVYRFNDRLSLSGGVTYGRSVEQFRYTSEQDTMVWETVGQDSVLRNAVLSRRIVHHNISKTLTVPLLLGAEFGKGKFKYGLQAGIGLNLLLSQNGKSLTGDNMITSYDSDDEATNFLPVPEFSIAYLLRPGLHYQLSTSAQLYLRGQMDYRRFGRRAFFGTRYGTLRFGVDVGMNYRF